MIVKMCKKRLTAAILSLCMTISMMTGYVFAEEIPMLEINEDTKTAIQLLEALDIIKDGDSFSDEEEITRGYFAALVSRALMINGGGADTRTMFRDVTADYEWANEIAGMYQLGYIAGGDDRKFRPEDKITLCEAATIAVTCLGYRQQAIAKGGWPNGYISEAGRLKLLSGNADKESMTHAEAALMIKNMLEAEAVVSSGVISNGAPVYKKEKNLLSILHSVYTVEGIVTENGLTGLYSAAAAENSIKVGDIRIQNTNGEDMTDMLGMYVKLYCREKDGEYEYMVSQYTSRNTVYTMNGWKDEVRYDRTNNAIRYDDLNKTKTIKMSRDFKFIYNGKLESDYLKYTADLSESTVKVIENNSDSLFDVLIMETYSTMVADTVGANSTKIASKYQGYDALNPDDYSRVDFTDTQGSRLAVSDISRGDVISWYASTDKSYARIIKSSRSVNGEITGIATSDNEYTIDGKSYKAAPTVKNGAVILEIGKKGTFGLDIFGRLAEFSKDIDSSEGFGMLIKYTQSDDFSGTVYAKLMNEYHELRTYTLAEKVKINGKSCKRNENGGQYSAIVAEAKKNDIEETKEDIVRFKIDSDGNIDSIDFAPAEIPQRDAVTDGMLYMYKKKATRPYKEDTGNMNDDFIVDRTSTVVFGIDTNFAYGDEDRYFVTSAASFGNDEFITAEAYTTKKEPDIAEAIVYYGVLSGNAMNFLAISTIREEVNDENEIVYIVNGFTPNGEIEATLDAELVEKYSIGEGDIVGGNSKLDAKGVLYDAQLLYDYSEKEMKTNLVGDGYFFHERAFMIYPYSYSGNVIKWFMAENREQAEAQFMNTGITEDALRNTMVPSGAIYVADGTRRGGIYKKGNMADIVSYLQDSENYSDVIVRSRWGNTQLIVVINK
ncbi:MAG: S-layer homology domain-containing protein [Candidatus Ornithomonoglobus sp.]